MGSYLYINGVASESKGVDEQIACMIKCSITRPGVSDNPFALSVAELATVVHAHSYYVDKDIAYQRKIVSEAEITPIYELTNRATSESLTEFDIQNFKSGFAILVRVLCEAYELDSEYEGPYPVSFQWG